MEALAETTALEYSCPVFLLSLILLNSLWIFCNNCEHHPEKIALWIYTSSKRHGSLFAEQHSQLKGFHLRLVKASRLELVCPTSSSHDIIMCPRILTILVIDFITLLLLIHPTVFPKTLPSAVFTRSAHAFVFRLMVLMSIRFWNAWHGFAFVTASAGLILPSIHIIFMVSRLSQNWRRHIKSIFKLFFWVLSS